MLSLCSFELLLFKGGTRLVKKYKAGLILLSCNLRLYSEHCAFGVVNAKGDTVQIHTVVPAGG